MLYELTQEQTGRVKPLFDDLMTFNVSIGAVIEGVCPGRVWADDADQPRSAFIITPEGSSLAGDPHNAAFNAALRSLVVDTILNPDGFSFFALVLTLDDAWIAQYDAIFPRPYVAVGRQHYVCTQVAHDWRAALPDGFSVRQIDADLLDAPGLDIPDHIQGWISGNWCHRANFLANGFGTATVHDAAQRVVSWSVADGVYQTHAEIGIHTLPDYRRRGLAAITAAANVEHAFSRGFTLVGWHCHDDNAGSYNTALKVGFVKERDYTHILCYAREADRLAEVAHQHFLAGDFRAEADTLAQACTQDDARPRIFFYAARALARVGDHAAALDRLRDAVTRGYADVKAITHDEALTPLHTLPGWNTLLAALEHKTQTPEKEPQQ